MDLNITFYESFSLSSADSFPAVSSLLSLLLDASGQGGLGGSDHAGITLFDIPESVPGSCLGALKPMLAAVAMKSLSSTASGSPAFSALPSPAAFSSGTSFQRTVVSHSTASHTNQATLTYAHSPIKVPNPSYSLARNTDSQESKGLGPVALSRGPNR